MRTKILKKTSELLVVKWESNLDGFGILTMQWDEKEQRFILDSENMGIDFVLEVLNNIDYKQ